MLTQEVGHLSTIEQIDAWLLALSRPDCFDDGDARNVLVHGRKAFGQLCAALAEQGYPNAAQMTVFAFQSTIDYLKEKHKPRN